MLNSVGNRYLDVPKLIWQHQNTKPDGPHEPSPSKEALEHMFDHLQSTTTPKKGGLKVTLKGSFSEYFSPLRRKER